MLLSSNVIQIYVRVVILVRMIRTRLPATLRAKSYPGMHNNWLIASSSKLEAWHVLWLYSQCWPSSKINGCPINWLMASLSKGIHWPLTQERLSLTPSYVGQALT